MDGTKHLSSIISSSIGNIIEWYDFGLFAIFSALFSQLFFPTKNPHLAVLATFSIFSIGFFFRPLGALLFGFLGDKYGRAITLRLSILMISIPTLLIGILPTYEQAGITAPIFLTGIRIWQGISIGGEYSGNIIYLAETAPAKFRAFYTAFANVGANFGILLASLVGIITTSLMPNDILISWGWRIPYLLSGILCIAIYRYRLKIKESQVFIYLKTKKKLTKNPIKILITKNISQLLRTIGLTIMGSTFYYFCFIFIPLYLAQNEWLSYQKTSYLISLLILLMIVIAPLSGLLSDHIGRRKILLIAAILITISVVPGFYFLQIIHENFLIIILFIFSLLSATEQGVTGVTIVENFPPPARYTGLSLGYNICNGFIGGTVPVVCGWLLAYTNFSLAPAIYIACCAFITGLVILFWMPETKGKDLR